MQFSAIVNRFIVKLNLILLLQMILKEKKIFRKMFIVADLVSLKCQKSLTFYHFISRINKASESFKERKIFIFFGISIFMSGWNFMLS